jgi:hypothetical protein
MRGGRPSGFWPGKTDRFPHLSTEASRRTSPTGAALYGPHVDFFVGCALRLRVRVPASFLSENVLIMVDRKPFITSANGSFPATHPTHAVLHWIGPGSQTTLPRSRPWRNRFRYFALLEILTYSNDHSFQ